MAARLRVRYRHDADFRPLFLRNEDVEAIAGVVREDLCADRPALTLDGLSIIDDVTVNGVSFHLSVCSDQAVHDTRGAPVMGLCDYDERGLPDTVMVMVNGISLADREDLKLSTLAHELGHALFDAPAWVARAASRPFAGLFDSPQPVAYRSVTRDEQHLAGFGHMRREERFAELRANEFMGALLVPRCQLASLLPEIAWELRVPLIAAHPAGDLFHPQAGPAVVHPETPSLLLDMLFGALSAEFGVSARFIEVRLIRYGMLANRTLRAAA